MAKVDENGRRTDNRGGVKVLPDYEFGAVPPSVIEATKGRLLRSETAWSTVESSLGFWVTWHLYGGTPGLVHAGRKRGSVYWKRRQFLDVFGIDVHYFQPEMIPLIHKMRAEK